MAIIPTLNSHSLRLRLGSCRVSLVGGWSCGETNTGISVCSSNVGSTLLIMYLLCTVCLLSSGSAGCVVNGSSAMSAS